MTNRHVVTKQQAPSIKSIIAELEAQLEIEVDPKSREQLMKYLEYWEGIIWEGIIKKKKAKGEESRC
ncbi:hypothetical protein LCGC14_0365980 [marine sediment metagenome]|uniref:Uncharacterized protein n=1 Tax=marine sediment metagenome TaxID=412755 RepID=A0A0F9VU13_9ZZZZ